MKMTWSGWKMEGNCYVLVKQFHENLFLKPLKCREIKSVFRDLKWCFDASRALRVNTPTPNKEQEILVFAARFNMRYEKICKKLLNTQKHNAVAPWAWLICLWCDCSWSSFVISCLLIKIPGDIYNLSLSSSKRRRNALCFI